MKIKKEVFMKFLKKVSMQGTNAINEAVFNFGEDGISVMAMTSDNTCMVNAKLRASSFEGYGALGEVGFDTIPMMIKIVSTFNEDVDIKINGGLLTLSEKNKSVDIPLIEPQFIPTKGKDVSKFEFEQTFNMPVKNINDFMKNVADANKNSFDMVFTTGDNALQLSNDHGKIKFREVVSDIPCQKGIRVKFGEPIMDALANLEGDVSVSLKSQFPIKVEEKSDSSVVTIVVAPRVEDENAIEVDAGNTETQNSESTEENSDE